MIVDPVDVYAHQMLVAADRIAQAHRTEDLTAIETEIAAALAIPAPPGIQPWRVLVGALAVQVDTDTPWRERAAWTLDVRSVPARAVSSAGYAGSGGWGGKERVA